MNNRNRRVSKLKAKQVWAEYGLKWNKKRTVLVLRKGASKQKIIDRLNEVQEDESY